jgi:EmrB/QacA subfamily drug resistance transporter
MRKGIILLLACLAQFMVILDLAIVNVALPTIGRQLGTSQATLQWVVIAYGLLFGGFLLLGGRLGDILGRRRVLLSGLVLFSLASLAAGLAGSASQLIAARAVQGFGAALIAPSALAILASTFKEGKDRNSALGIFGAVGGASGAVGVFTSGLLTDGPGWSWIFFINVPVGALLISLALKYLPRDAVQKGLRSFNASAAATLTGGLIALVYGLNKGAEAGWASPWTLASFAAAAALLFGFRRIESRSQSPLVTLTALQNRSTAGTMVTALLGFGSFFSFIFVMTLFLQQHLHYSATQTGLTWLVPSLTAFVVAGYTGTKLVARVGVKRPLIAGLSLIGLAMLLLVRIPIDAVFVRDLLPSMLLTGLGMGMFAPSVQISALSGAKPEHMGLMSGVTETMREFGGVLTIALVSTVLLAQNWTLSAFHAGFLVMGGAAALGLITFNAGLQRTRQPKQEILTQTGVRQEYAKI